MAKEETAPATTEPIADGSAPYAGWGADGDAPAGLKKRKKKKKLVLEKPALTLNSLMDIVTILLVYLLKSYATSPIEVKDPATEIPISSSMENVEEATVVMITGPEKSVPNPNNPKGESFRVPNIPHLVVDGSPLLALDEATYRVPAQYKDPASGGFVIMPLREKLKEAKEMQSFAATVSDTLGFSGKVVIIADKRTPYRVLTEVLVTCGQAGFGEFRFAIVKEK